MYFLNSKKQKNKGQVMIFAVVVFVSLAIASTIGIVNPAVRHIKAMENYKMTKQSYYLAESGIEDVIYRLKNGIQTNSQNVLEIDGESSVTTISDEIGGGKIISSVSNFSDYQRKIESSLVVGEGVSFNYALQSGNGGFFIDGGSVVDGNVYSNGNITGDGGSTITGSATAANSDPLGVETENVNPMPNPSEIIFGNTTANQDFAQSFVVGRTGPLNKISLYIKRTSSLPGNLSVKIVTDNNNSPSTNILDSATLSASLVSTSYGWVDAVFGNYVQLSSGVKYWFVLDGGNNSTKYYTLGANNTFADGSGKSGRYGSSWTDISLDSYFKVYMNGFASKITGDGYDYLNIGTKGGDSWAHTVNSTNTYGTIYCQTGSMNNGKVCNTERSDPPAQPLPISDSNINGWKDEALAGGIQNGDVSVGWSGATMGPVKIIGNLSISGGGTLTLTGTVWVTGNITVSGGGKVRLASSYGERSGVLISDGRVSISGNGQFSGSGTAGSFPLLITTNNCPYGASCGGNPALSINGGSGAVVLAAPYGVLSMSGGTSAKAMVAYKITITGGGEVRYDTGLVDMRFSSGPSGGFEIVNWAETE